jgi:cytidine deaminase
VEKINEQDELLIKIAKNIINRRFKYGVAKHTVATAIRCVSGNVYTGINLHSNNGYCAEVIALGAALTAGESEIECVVTIEYSGKLLSPCGTCRQLFAEYAKNSWFIFSDDVEGIVKKQIEHLLPYAYKNARINQRMLEYVKSQRKGYDV